jgi:hypothetical protein
MPVPDFSPGEVLTAAAMDSIGLWLVSTTTIGTGVTSVPVNNCFSSNYKSYRIIIENNDTNGSASHDIQLQGIAANYYMAGHFWAWTVPGATTNYSPPPQTTFIVSANTAASAGTGIIVDITNPNLALRKYGWVTSQAGNGAFTANLLNLTATASTGFTLGKGGNTMTGGQIRVYGYRN